MMPGGRIGGAAVAGLAGFLALLVAAAVAQRAEREAAERSAQSAAAYLALVTPNEPHTSIYQLVQLLAQARGLGTLPGWSGAVEVYHGTAPLVHATAPPLSRSVFENLRDREGPRLAAGTVLVPLKDKDGWDVVGGVAVRVHVAEDALLGGWGLVLLLLFAAAGAGAMERGRRALLGCAMVALLVGVVAYRRAAGGESDATDRWLERSRVLLSEASSRLPWNGTQAAAARLAPLAPGAALSPADSGNAEIRREMQGGAPRAVVRVALGPGRWLSLVAIPGELNSAAWLAVTLALAALGPLGVLLLGWYARTRSRPRALRETLAAWGFLAPASVHLAAFSLAPLLFVFYLSVHRWSPTDPVRPFVGLDNFSVVLRDPLVWASLGRTLLFTTQVPVAMAIALIAALLLQRHTGSPTLARAVFLLPYLTSTVAIALLWQWMLHPYAGLFNVLAQRLGWRPIDWLGDPRSALPSLMAISIWVQVGYQTVLFLAGLQAIPEHYLDAARVDGATTWQRFWRVTFPLLRPVTVFVLVTGIIVSFQVFTLVYVLTAGGPLHATDLIVYRIYETAWGAMQFGSASALSLVLFVVLFGVTWVQFRMLRRRVEYA
jgi:multiple sugar transport system permease protein